MKNKHIHLLAFYSRVPKNKKDSHKKDFGKTEDNWAMNEHVQFSLGLRDKDLVSANIILDLNEKKVVKCTLKEGLSFIQLFSYFKQNYPQYVKILDEAMYGNKEDKVPEALEARAGEQGASEVQSDAPIQISNDTPKGEDNVSVQTSETNS